VFWSDQPTRLTGIILIVFAATILLAVIIGGAASGEDPFARDKIDDYLVDIEENKGAAIVALFFSIAGHAAFGIAAAPALYLLLRDRGRLFALAGFAFGIVAQAAFLISDAAYNAIINLASDFAEGGPEGFEAGDPAILRDARSVAILGDSAQVLGITTLSLFNIAFGALIGWAPQGEVNPPRWVGWVAVAAGVAGILAWLIVLADFAFIFFVLSGLLTIIWLIALGLWLLTSGKESRPAEAVSA
jgi:hypothetical protein